jgi:hypothetical protein
MTIDQDLDHVRKMTIGELLDMFDPPPFAEAAAHTWRGSHAQADLGADVLPASVRTRR